MDSLDWLIIVGYGFVAFGVSLFFSKRARRDSESFFVAGRSLGWFVAGTSMVATTFAADTPLFIAGIARSEGIYGNWFWWSAAPAAIATMFFFAPLWRRSRVLTDIEFIALRYPSSLAASALRVGRALYDGIFTNAIILSAVTLAIAKVIAVTTGLSEQPIIAILGIFSISPTFLVLLCLGALAVIYTMLSGLYGVVYTDLIQFALAMIGSIGLAAIAYVSFQNDGGMQALAKTEGFQQQLLHFVPNLSSVSLEAVTFLILISFSWLGMSAGNGYFIQRILATKSEKDAVLAFSWYTIANYILRSWPWIIVGIVSILYFPNLADAEKSYPLMIERFLPIGLKGIMIASLLAAFMSTLDTHLNWGASYLINDVYKPYINRHASKRHYVHSARLCMVAIMALGVAIASQLDSILSIHKFFGLMTVGIAFVSVARWYWWRVTIWTEIAALVSSTIIGTILLFAIPDTPQHDFFAVRLLVNIVATTAISIFVTYHTSPPQPAPQTISFYEKIRPSGRGWSAVAKQSGAPLGEQNLRSNLIGWLSSLITLYCLLFAIGHWLLEDWQSGLLLLAIAVVSGRVAYTSLRDLLTTIAHEENKIEREVTPAPSTI